MSRPRSMGRDNPLISVIVPCYRQARYLADAVESVKAQTLANWECLIIDDGSPDDTRDVAASLLGDPRIRYLWHENRGVAYSRNRGIQEAKGRYIQFLDADDLLLSGKWERQLDALRGIPGFGVSYTDYRYCTEAGIPVADHPWHRCPRLKPGRELEDLILRWQVDLGIAIHSFLFDETVFTQGKVRFDESLPANEDWDCWIQVFGLRPTAIYIDKPYVLYRLNEGGRSRSAARLKQGLLDTIQKQRKVFARDKAITGALKRKARMVRRTYWARSAWDIAVRTPLRPVRDCYRHVVRWLRRSRQCT